MFSKKRMTIVYLFYEYLAEGVGGLSHIWEVSKNIEEQGHKIVRITTIGDNSMKIYLLGKL